MLPAGAVVRSGGGLPLGAAESRSRRCRGLRSAPVSAGGISFCIKKGIFFFGKHTKRGIKGATHSHRRRVLTQSVTEALQEITGHEQHTVFGEWRTEKDNDDDDDGGSVVDDDKNAH